MKPLLLWKSHKYCCVFVELIIQHAKRMRRIICHLWPLWLHHVLQPYFISSTILGAGVDH